MTDDEMLALNELTGRVHKYEGPGLGRPLSCGCEGFAEAVDAGALTVIRARHLERGIWEPADCLRE